MMEGGGAHAGLPGQFFDAQGLGKVAPEPFGRPGDLMAQTSLQGNLPKPHPLFSHQQTIEDLPLNEGGQQGNVLLLLKQPDQPFEGVDQGRRHRPGGHAAP